MRVSIITATYNSGRTLQETINSVISQNYNNIEYIIIDGASTDDTLKIIEENKQYISQFVSEPDDGIYDAFNKGIKLATGDVIGFLNSDDIFHNEKVISTVVKSLKDSKADLVYGDLVYRSNPKGKEDSRIIRYWRSNDFVFESLSYGWMPPHPTLYCLREVYEKYGLFDNRFKLASDYDFILRIFKQKELKKVYIPKVLVRMYVGGVSNRSLKNIIQNVKENYISIRENKIGGVVTLLCKKFRKLYQFRNFLKI